MLQRPRQFQHSTSVNFRQRTDSGASVRYSLVVRHDLSRDARGAVVLFWHQYRVESDELISATSILDGS